MYISGLNFFLSIFSEDIKHFIPITTTVYTCLKRSFLNHLIDYAYFLKHGMEWISNIRMNINKH